MTETEKLILYAAKSTEKVKSELNRIWGDEVGNYLYRVVILALEDIRLTLRVRWLAKGVTVSVICKECISKGETRLAEKEGELHQLARHWEKEQPRFSPYGLKRRCGSWIKVPFKGISRDAEILAKAVVFNSEKLPDADEIIIRSLIEVVITSRTFNRILGEAAKDLLGVTPHYTMMGYLYKVTY